jgi:hypothetical protein
MTEAEWLTCPEPEKLLRFLRGRPSGRKLRLLAVACVRRQWHLLGPAARRVVEQAEAHADGSAPRPEIEVGGTGPDPRQTAEKAARYTAAADPAEAARGAASEASDAVAEGVIETTGANRHEIIRDEILVAANAAGVREGAHQADLIRDIFGNPFRPGAVNPACRTPTVLALAQAAYDNRHLPAGTLDGARLAILADALEDVGADPAILDHLHGPGPQVRGYWVLDLVLGRE